MSEHVAFLYWSDAHKVYSVGLPESGEGRLMPVPGSLSDWILRARAIDAADAEAMVIELTAKSGEVGQSDSLWYYTSKFILFDERGGIMATNCMGLVVNALHQNGLETLPATLGFEIHTNFINRVRRKPTIGHLARALTGAVPLPYSPPDRTEATEYASCLKTKEEAESGLLP